MLISKSVKSSKVEAIDLALYQSRIGTINLFEGIDRDTFCRQVHPDFSPIGWHLGHIAYIEELWLLQRCAGLPPVFPQYQKLFAADILPKKERVHLPQISEVRLYVDTVRQQVLEYLEVAPIEEQERLWHFVLQHESQHCETISFLLLMHQQEVGIIQKKEDINFFPREDDKDSVPKKSSQPSLFLGGTLIPLSPTPTISPSDMVEIPAGKFEMGNSSIDALDNERSLHQRYLETYWIDRYPVTCGEYGKFMKAGGYQDPQWWSKKGWEWLQASKVDRPVYWSSHRSFDNHPVCGVSWYEADAYSRFVGKRLPTEAEWEKAASWDDRTFRKRTYPWGDEQPNAHRCNYARLNPQAEGFPFGNHPANNQKRTTPVDAFPGGTSAYGCWDMLGNVWEWTSSWFEAYEGFESYPYRGYSHTYFDGEHKVMRGGSWATRSWTLRSSFRNWYHPGDRQMLAGFRCAFS